MKKKLTKDDIESVVGEKIAQDSKTVNFVSFIYCYIQTLTGFNTNLRFAGSNNRTSCFTFSYFSPTTMILKLSFILTFIFLYPLLCTQEKMTKD